MKIIDGFTIRDVCGCYVVMADGMKHRDFNKILNLNETAAYLWKAVQGKEFTEDTLVELLTAEYEVSAQTALADARKLIEDWKSAGVLE